MPLQARYLTPDKLHLPYSSAQTSAVPIMSSAVAIFSMRYSLATSKSISNLFKLVILSNSITGDPINSRNQQLSLLRFRIVAPGALGAGCEANRTYYRLSGKSSGNFALTDKVAMNVEMKGMPFV
ncbi:hypothetical protein BKA70DRAFT_1220390 [Coprinopsis sp. MPI-PUGE-AT-0042]|nr:hypothetical protein BKA70DRAFT_1220390 [Coprinopsis sp. MPI-PUGE-AT-0042]